MVDLDFIWKHCSFDDWDGHGADALPGEVMQTARAMFEKFPDLCRGKVFEVTPDSNKRIMFEWAYRDELYIVVEFGLMDFSAFSRNGEIIEHYPDQYRNGKIADLPALFETQIRNFINTHGDKQ
jgi:hypothetical protein